MNLVQLICCALLTKVADLATDQTIGARVGHILAGGSRRLITGDIQGAFDELKIAGSEICVCPPQVEAEAKPEEAPGRRLRNFPRSWQKSRKHLKFDKS
jgi:hypothetical protein